LLFPWDIGDREKAPEGIVNEKLRNSKVRTYPAMAGFLIASSKAKGREQKI
jgi:hypothetical protein